MSKFLEKLYEVMNRRARQARLPSELYSREDYKQHPELDPDLTSTQYIDELPPGKGEE
jgi:hypothetical protein